MLTLLALMLVGFAAGTLGALLGLGGGIFLVPALTTLFGLPIRVAVGTSLIGAVATSAAVNSVSRPGRSADYGLALRLETASAGGALVGSLLAGHLQARTLAIIFGGIALVTALYTLRKARRKPRATSDAAVEALFRSDYRPVNWPAGLGLTALAGALSGLTGSGGGFIKVPVMYSIMNVPLGVATASSNFMVGITAAASAFVYYGRGDIYPVVVIPTAVGVFAGALFGARMAPRLRVESLRLALIGLLILIGVQMIWKGIAGT